MRWQKARAERQHAPHGRDQRAGAVHQHVGEEDVPGGHRRSGCGGGFALAGRLGFRGLRRVPASIGGALGSGVLVVGISSSSLVGAALGRLLIAASSCSALVKSASSAGSEAIARQVQQVRRVAVVVGDIRPPGRRPRRAEGVTVPDGPVQLTVPLRRGWMLQSRRMLTPGQGRRTGPHGPRSRNCGRAAVKKIRAPGGRPCRTASRPQRTSDGGRRCGRAP